MDKFSEKSLLSLGDYYVYGLIDPLSKQIFYIGKGTKNRVFEKSEFSEVALMMGYENPSKFSEAFYAVMGCKPNAYRKSQKSSAAV